jgi:type IV pilus assembly protein PilV
MNIQQKRFTTIANNHVTNSNGFTLLEVLIAVLILSIGLLGIAGLQAKGLQFNHSAYLRTQATFLAYDIADRMRANMVGVTAGNYNAGAANADAQCITAGSALCSTSDMAGHDLSEWNAALASALPGGNGIVCIDAYVNTEVSTSSGSADCGTGASTQYAIKIWWTDDRSGNAKRFVMVFEP